MYYTAKVIKSVRDGSAFARLIAGNVVTVQLSAATAEENAGGLAGVRFNARQRVGPGLHDTTPLRGWLTGSRKRVPASPIGRWFNVQTGRGGVVRVEITGEAAAW